MRLEKWLYSHTKDQLMALTNGKMNILKMQSEEIEKATKNKPKGDVVESRVVERHGKKEFESNIGAGMKVDDMMSAFKLAGIPIIEEN